MSEIKCCKEKLLAILEEILQNENSSISFNSKSDQICRNFYNYCELVKLADQQFKIARSETNQLVLVAVLKEFSRFFFEQIPKLSEETLKKWDFLLIDEGFAKQELTFSLSKQCIFGNRLYLHQKRLEAEKNAELQRILREELIKKQTVPDEIELNLEHELLNAKILNVDEACLIIQCAERMYQSINRYLYLVEVKQRALEIHEKVLVNPEKAVIRIQAITRGYLARKRVAEMRSKEHQVLGMKVGSWLKSNITNRQQKHSAEDVEPFFISAEKILYPENLQELLELLRSNFFVEDPLKLEDDPPTDTLKRFDEKVENLIQDLLVVGVMKIQMAKSGFIPFDDLTSYSVQIQTSKQLGLRFDLRIFLYAAVIIPHVVSGWPNYPIKRHSILFVGDSKSGKSTWTDAIQEKCMSPKILVNKRLFMRKFVRRKQLVAKILQFVRQDCYVIVEFDGLEMFHKNTRKKSPVKAIIRNLLFELFQRNCQIIGMSRNDQLESEILSHFDVIYLKPLPPIERYELMADCLSRRMEEDRLTRVPQRLYEIAKTTKKLNCGQTVEKVDSRFSKGIAKPK